MTEWWSSFFDDDYLRLWGPTLSTERTAADVEALWSLLELAPGKRVLDAPCGFGRLSRPLASRGAVVMRVPRARALPAARRPARGARRLNTLRGPSDR